MVVLNKIYTKTGDAGTTALGTGQRVAKYDLRISAYGTVDETNAVIGVVRLELKQQHTDLDGVLAHIQNDLFDIGADLCTPDRGEKLEYEPLRLADVQVAYLENQIDHFNADIKPLRTFVLPGGSAAGAHLHVARTVCRRAERLVVELAGMADEPVSTAVTRYLNRLSDFLFVASRYVNAHNGGDELWVPGKNRG